MNMIYLGEVRPSRPIQYLRGNRLAICSNHSDSDKLRRRLISFAWTTLALRRHVSNWRMASFSRATFDFCFRRSRNPSTASLASTAVLVECGASRRVPPLPDVTITSLRRTAGMMISSSGTDTDLPSNRSRPATAAIRSSIAREAAYRSAFNRSRS